jgi:hypothetical protein
MSLSPVMIESMIPRPQEATALSSTKSLKRPFKPRKVLTVNNSKAESLMFKSANAAVPVSQLLASISGVRDCLLLEEAIAEGHIPDPPLIRIRGDVGTIGTGTEGTADSTTMTGNVSVTLDVTEKGRDKPDNGLSIALDRGLENAADVDTVDQTHLEDDQHEQIGFSSSLQRHLALIILYSMPNINSHPFRLCHNTTQSIYKIYPFHLSNQLYSLSNLTCTTVPFLNQLRSTRSGFGVLFDLEKGATKSIRQNDGIEKFKLSNLVRQKQEFFYI